MALQWKWTDKMGKAIIRQDETPIIIVKSFSIATISAEK